MAAVLALQMRRRKPRQEQRAAHQPVGRKGWGLVFLSVHACVCVCGGGGVSTGPYMCARKVFVWGATLCMYLWHMCDVPCASLSLSVHTRLCTCAHMLPVSAVVCVLLSWAPWTVALHVLLGGGGVGVGLGLPTLVPWCPGFSELTPALLWPSTWVSGQPWLSTGLGAIPGFLV